MRKFVLTTGPHGSPSIVLHDATHEEHAYLRSAITFIDSPFYQAKSKVSAFLQGGYDGVEGWIYVEFWCHNKEELYKYMEFISSKEAIEYYKD